MAINLIFPDDSLFFIPLNLTPLSIPGPNILFPLYLEAYMKYNFNLR